jgi:hypothetical protein
LGVTNHRPRQIVGSRAFDQSILKGNDQGRSVVS